MHEITHKFQVLQSRLNLQKIKIDKTLNDIHTLQDILQTTQPKTNSLRYAQMQEIYTKFKSFAQIFSEKIQSAYGELQSISLKIAEYGLLDSLFLEKVDMLITALEEATGEIAHLTNYQIKMQHYTQLDDTAEEKSFISLFQKRMDELLKEQNPSIALPLDKAILERIVRILTLHCTCLLHALSEEGLIAFSREIARKSINFFSRHQITLSKQNLSALSHQFYINEILKIKGSKSRLRLLSDGRDITLISGEKINSDTLFENPQLWTSFPATNLPQSYVDIQSCGSDIFKKSFLKNLIETDTQFAKLNRNLMLLKQAVSRKIAEIKTSSPEITSSSLQQKKIITLSPNVPIIHRTTPNEIETYAYEHRLDNVGARGSFREYIQQKHYSEISDLSFIKIDARNLSLKGCNLIKGIFSHCDFRGTDFTQTTIYQADFSDALFDDDEKPNENHTVSTKQLFKLQKEIETLLEKSTQNVTRLAHLVNQFFEEFLLLSSSPFLTKFQKSKLQELILLVPKFAQAYLDANVLKLKQSLAKNDNDNIKQELIKQFIINMQLKLSEWKRAGNIDDCFINLENIDVAGMRFPGISFSHVKVNKEQLAYIVDLKLIKDIEEEKLHYALAHKYRYAKKLLTELIDKVEFTASWIEAYDYLDIFACKGEMPDASAIPEKAFKLCVLSLLVENDINLLPYNHPLCWQKIYKRRIFPEAYLEKELSEIVEELQTILLYRNYDLAPDLVALIRCSGISILYETMNEKISERINEITEITLSDLENEQLEEITSLKDKYRRLRTKYREEKSISFTKADQNYINSILENLDRISPYNTDSKTDRLKTAQEALESNPDLILDVRECNLTSVEIRDLNVSTSQVILSTEQFQNLLTPSQRQVRIDACQKNIKEGDIKKIKSWLNAGIDINIKATDGRTPLMDACFHGYTEIARLLLECGADPSAVTPRNISIIDGICLLEDRSADHLKIIQLLKIYGITPNFHSLIALGDFTAVQKVIESGEVNINQSLRGESPLHFAVNFGQIEIVALLLSHGADPLLPNDKRKLPIESACWHGHVEIVRLLLNIDFDIDRKDAQNKTLLYHAAKKGFRELANLLIQYGAEVDIESALLLNLKEEISDYLKKNPDSSDELVHLALKLNAEKALIWLIESFANIHQSNASGRFPLELICEKNFTDAIRILLKKLGDQATSAIADCKKHPLFIAVQKQNIDIAKCLLENGANPDVIEPSLGRSCLHQAVKDGNLPMVELLVSHQANLGCRDNRGYLPLHAAAEKGDEAIIQCLVQGYYNAQTRNHKTPCDLLPKDANSQLFALLSCSFQKASLRASEAEKVETVFGESFSYMTLPIFMHILNFVFEDIEEIQQQAAQSLPLVSQRWCGFYQQYKRSQNTVPTVVELPNESYEPVNTLTNS